MKTLIVLLCMFVMFYILGNTDQATDPLNEYYIEIFILLVFTYGIIYVLKPND